MAVEFRWTETAKGAAHEVAKILRAQGYQATPQESPAEREPGLVYTNAHGRDVMAARGEVESSENPRSRSRREVPESKIKHKTLEEAIWIIAPAWVGGDPNDKEVREIVSLAREIEKTTYNKYYQLKASELAAAAINEYYTT
jgi:hypothetical protein